MLRNPSQLRHVGRVGRDARPIASRARARSWAHDRSERAPEPSSSVDGTVDGILGVVTGVKTQSEDDAQLATAGWEVPGAGWQLQQLWGRLLYRQEACIKQTKKKQQ